MGVMGTVLGNNTLYALKSDDKLEAMLRVYSITRKETTEDVDFTCSILFDIDLPRRTGRINSDFLVHLDNNAFLLLRIASLFQCRVANNLLKLFVLRLLETVEFRSTKSTMIPKHCGVSFIPIYSFLLPAIESEDIVEKEAEDNIFLDLIRDTKLEPQLTKSWNKDFG